MAGEMLDLHRGCARAREWVSLRIDGELSELERLLLRRHLSRCVGCRDFAEAVATTTEVVRATPDEQPSRPLEPVQPRISQRRRTRYRLAAAAAVVAIGAGLGAAIAVQGNNVTPSQPGPDTEIAQLPPTVPPPVTTVDPPPVNV